MTLIPIRAIGATENRTKIPLGEVSMLNSRQLTSLLKITLVMTFVSGLVISGLGGWFVYLGASGETSFTFFDQAFKSTNIGLAAIFIGGVLIVLTVRRGLSAIEQVASGTPRHAGGARSNSNALKEKEIVLKDKEEKGMDSPSIVSLDGLEHVVSRLSQTQKDILAHTLRFGENGIHVQDLVDGMGLKRAEIVYRARDLQTLGLIEIRNLTDMCLFLSDAVRRLRGQSTSATDAILRQGSKVRQKTRRIGTSKEPKND